ncbi:ankyrin repeat domain-containing protein [Bordetella sp. 02P26C-1]|uniref:ankyrin repeat domain-containing protein n=1 Tax=Bordetella sp. 02P26C-1 TaxID=2683195 RepID=UPI0013536B1A|nr:ankyrin repeat domain-containing protein [Bordetella sp. 02P26C-1]MVW77554.1 hypothetical protein [Bordetella sp. 02P26C-1]
MFNSAPPPNFNSSALGSIGQPGLDAESHDIETALQSIIGSNDAEEFNILVSGLGLNLGEYRFSNGQNCLHLAIERDSYGIALQLTQPDQGGAGLDENSVRDLLNGKDAEGKTPLTYALERPTDTFKWVRLLVWAGAVDEDSSALAWAAKNGHATIVNSLIKANVNQYLDKELGRYSRDVRKFLNTGEKGEGLSNALREAAVSGNTKIVQSLIRVNAPDKSSEALRGAAGRGQEAVVTPLLATGMYDREDLTRASSEAMRNGHIEIAVRLCAKGGNPSEVLADSLGFGGPSGPKRITAIRGLMNIGADTTAAMVSAVRKGTLESLPTLSLLGADCTALAASLVIDKDIEGFIKLMKSGVSIGEVVTLLSGSGRTEAAEFLLRQTVGSDPTLPVEITRAIPRLARNPDPALLEAIFQPGPPSEFRCNWHLFAIDGNLPALQTLNDLELINSDSLALLVRGQHLGGVQTALRAGIPASDTLRTLHDDYIAAFGENYQADHDENWKGIALLILAGADVSELPAGLKDQILATINARQTVVAGLSEDEKVQQLQTATTSGSMLDIALLLEQDADASAALSMMAPNDRRGGIQTLLDAGVVATDLLIDCVKTGRTELAQTVNEVVKPELPGKDSLTTEVLRSLLAQNDLSTAGAVLSDVTDGVDALIQFARKNEENSAKLLFQLGVPGSTALLQSLRAGEYDVASKLIAYGADVQTALEKAAAEKPSTWRLDRSTNDILDALAVAGADLQKELLRAAERGDTTAAKTLIRHRFCNKTEAVARVVEDDTLSDAVKTGRLEFLRDAGLDMRYVLDTLTGDSAATLRRLFGTQIARHSLASAALLGRG